MPNGTAIAPDWAGLVDGNINTPLNQNQNGTAAVPLGTTNCDTDGNIFAVRTATSSSGGLIFLGAACNGFTTTADGPGYLVYGDSLASDFYWSSQCVDYEFCSTLAHIYCFEQ